MKFAERLRQARKACELKQYELAKMAYIHRNAISTYELGHRLPTLDMAVSLAQVLGVSLDWLVGLSDEGGPEEWEWLKTNT